MTYVRRTRYVRMAQVRPCTVHGKDGFDAVTLAMSRVKPCAVVIVSAEAARRSILVGCGAARRGFGGELL